MEEITEKKAKFLRVLSPKLYRFLTSQLEEQFHIHSYDIQLEGIQEENGILVILQYGEGFTHVEEEVFSMDEIEQEGEDLQDFVQRTGEACREVMIADYYKMVKP
ncbi:hypothetical protein ACFOGI_10265 [Virgibacillus xinjiangensis]|uniref:Uncharacterized protein n=1 Tax=Virgibacillus xinjiangensis TaxID=393090 RepID=A0ABV7CWU4_9BACI